MFDQMKQMKQLMAMLGDAEGLKARMEAMQEQLAGKTVDAEAGAGAVRVTVNGRFEITQLRLDPAMLAALAGGDAEADKALVEDLVTAAVNQAMRRAQDMVKQEMMGATGLSLPGM